MNKQNNIYTIVYASVMVIVVAAVLAFTALQLKPKQQKNVEIDKMTQILSSVKISANAENAQELYKKYIVDSYVIDEAGNKLEGKDAFTVDVAVQSKIADDKRELPVFVCRLEDGSEKYILPMYGAGLWGPIWGYVSVDTDGNTIYGAYFAHQGETPGLGAEIEKPEFSDQYAGKHFFVDGTFKSVAVEKKGQKPIDGAEYVDAISGGTITSKGVQTMMQNCIIPYQNFLKSLK
ncbi:NADH:ubiquinone reductase (Na(+)-transporting) subunit C [Coprobacter tertius]|uniref:Na(+)-translocating NADH-quinone reductase subunit C n=1 Tax=Coprobacter tertius TaxID=2944915 RepID=A0ABT1MLF5_9BACT|nr:NADH:ubiquinone reductase (Na(+)-transporting) subunit C [Coprobacter tertius]MCP9612716.1 NADH:ubiquinone reductase (Na(+)-transporting) subunit C [Coprobacter tertius]